MIPNIFYKADFGSSYTRRPIKNIDTMIIGILDIFDGLVKILTLGFYGAGLSIDYVEWRIKQMLDKEIRKEQ